jgi:L-ascorbate metabolism protein UlaG (beta-lactamase superfamily)
MPGSPRHSDEGGDGWVDAGEGTLSRGEFKEKTGGDTMVENIHWLGHDTFKIEGEKIIFTDPFKLQKKDAADIILITHEHYDHCSPEDVEKIQGPDTVIVATEDCRERLKGNVKIVTPGDRITVEGVEIEVVPSYNTNKEFHPKGRNWVGYVFTVNGRRIYLAGDTDHIPEMKDIRCDIALLPVSGTYVMTAEEAVRAALDIKPVTAIPMHYGAIVGDESDAERFRGALEGKIDVVILAQEE